MPSAEEDRRWLVEQWQALFGKLPTAAELEAETRSLQRGQVTRSQWVDLAQRWDAQNTVARFYKEILGREFNPADPRDAAWVPQLANGTITQAQLRERLSGSAEALLRQPDAPNDDAEQDAFTYLKRVLDDYGLGNLGDWAWQQIQGGRSNERIIQDLRETTEYKQRFAGLELRRAKGLPAISEAEYIAYESGVRQMMRAAGMPADFYDQPDDFAKLIGNDVSVAEMQARVNDGYLAATQAPAEVRQELQSLYGISTGGLAAFFLDPDRALPLIERQFAAAQVSGAAQRTGYGALDKTEAERIAALGVGAAEAQQGFSALQQSRELFGSLPGEDAAQIDRATQQAAVFGGDANARAAIDKRAKERVSQGSGAQSFAVGQGGVAGLGRE